MKQLNGAVHRSAFSSVFVKFAAGLLLVGLAYRLVCAMQFPPVFVGNNTQQPLGQTMASEDAAEASPPPRFSDDNRASGTGSSSKCDLFSGDWVPDPDGPMYTNATCSVIDGPQNCIQNGRPDSGYIYWRWKPSGCDLPKFDPKKFIEMMRNKSLAFIGDSIMRNQVQSLLCMLSQVEQAVDVYHDKQYKNRRWTFPSYQFNVSLVWSPFLTKAFTFEDDNGVSTGGLIQIHLDEPDAVWTQQFKDHDYIIIGGGKWFLKSALYYKNNTIVGCHNCHDPNITQLGFNYAYRNALNTTLNFITSSNKKGVTLFRSLTPDHFENGEWNTGGYCNRTQPFKTGEVEINDTDDIMRRAELEEFEQAAAAASAKGMRLKLFDATLLSLLRPDGHPGVYRQSNPYAGKDELGRIQNDCLHWCLPGPVDAWNDLVMEMLIRND